MLVYLPTPCTYITKSFNVMKMMRWNEPATLAVKVLDVMLRQDIEFHQRRWSLVCWLTLWCGWHVNKRRGKKFQMTIHSLLSPKQRLAFCIFLPCWLRKMLKELMTSLAAIHTVISKNRKLKLYSYCKRWFWTKISSDNGP